MFHREILECIYWSIEFSPPHKLRGLRPRGDNHSPRAAGFFTWASVSEHAGFRFIFYNFTFFFFFFIMRDNVAPNRRESSSTRTDSLMLLFTF